VPQPNPNPLQITIGSDGDIKTSLEVSPGLVIDLDD